jgi:hypothetical protein
MSATAHKSSGYNRKKNNDTVGRSPNISVLHMIVIDYQCHLKTSYHRLLQSSNEYFREVKAFLQKNSLLICTSSLTEFIYYIRKIENMNAEANMSCDFLLLVAPFRISE